MQQLTQINGAPVVDKFNTQAAGARGPASLQNSGLLKNDLRNAVLALPAERRRSTQPEDQPCRSSQPSAPALLGTLV